MLQSVFVEFFGEKVFKQCGFHNFENWPLIVPKMIIRNLSNDYCKIFLLAQ